MDEPIPKVNCGDCGYLGHQADCVEGLLEITVQCRETGHLQVPNSGRQVANLVCSQSLQKFPNEPSKSGPVVLGLMNEERYCKSFFRRCPGKNPKEHEEMSLLEKMEAREARLIEKADLQRREDLDWRKSVEDSIDRRHNTLLIQQTLLAFLAAIVTLIGAKLIPWFNSP